MKKFGTMVAFALLCGCTQEKSTTHIDIPENRIQLIEERVINGYRYSILKVDSVEYLTQDNGGFVRITK